MRLLIESDPVGVRMALLADGRLTEFLSEIEGDSLVGDVYHGRIRRLAPAIDAAFVDIGGERHAFLHESDFHLEEGERLEVNAPIVVQVYRDPLPGKGARVRRGMSLPGRFAVLLAPGDGVAVSSRIEDEDEALRLAGALEGIGDGVGWIVRTAAVGVSVDTLRSEGEELLALYRILCRRAAEGRPVRRLHRDLDPIERWLRDRLHSGIDEIVVDDEAMERRVRAVLEVASPELVERLNVHTDPESLLAAYGAEAQIAGLASRRVPLPSGGSLVIEPTEALLAVDVNSGRDLGAMRLEETALATNLEAAAEVARQLRLRDLAGIVVIDFIDLEEPDHWERVLDALRSALEADKAATQVEALGAFGLVGVTRKRGREDLWRRTTTRCGACQGSGRLPSLLETVRSAGRELRSAERRAGGRRWRLRLPAALPGESELADPAARRLQEDLEGRLEVETAADLEAGTFELTEVSS